MPSTRQQISQPSHYKILNLVGQTIAFGRVADAYENAPENRRIEEFYMKEWRKKVLLGMFLDIVSYTNTPKQWSYFEDCQRETVNSAEIM